jgi:hypothetical protein
VNSKFLATSSRNETTLDTSQRIGDSSRRLNDTSRRLNDKTGRSRDQSLRNAHNGSEDFYSSDDGSEESYNLT